jgi:hypothetical protein
MRSLWFKQSRRAEYDRPATLPRKVRIGGYNNRRQTGSAQPRRSFHFGPDEAQGLVHRRGSGRRHRPLYAPHYAALAEEDRRMISERTKQALASAKANGRQLGGLRDHGRAAKEAVVERAKALAPIFDELAEQVCPGNCSHPERPQRRHAYRQALVSNDHRPRARSACCGLTLKLGRCQGAQALVLFAADGTTHRSARCRMQRKGTGHDG